MLLLAQAAVMTVTPLTYRAAVYDPEQDFEAVSVIAETPMMFVAHPGAGVGSLPELLAAARARPDAVVLGSPVRGSIPHLSVELPGLLGGVRFNTVQASSSAQAIQAVDGGDSAASVDGVAPLLPRVKTGRVVPLAVTSDRVLPGLEPFRLAKDAVPCLVPRGWFMLFAPKGSPGSRLQALNAAIDAALARDRAREVNEFAASVVRRMPGRFAFFATLTLPDVEGAIAEARDAFDRLGADGVVLLANVGGTCLGEPAWEPLLAELNARAAVVFVHPSALPAPEVPGIPPFAADFLLDTTRAAIRLAACGALERYPDLRFVLSHAGGFLPYAAERVARVCSPDGGIEGGIVRLRRFRFDLALSSTPCAPKERSWHFARSLDAYPLAPTLRRAIDRGNAERLFARLACEARTG